MARSRSRASWSYVPRRRIRPVVRAQGRMVDCLQRLVARGWAAAPPHPGMRPPEGTPGITKLRSEQDSCRAAIFFGRPEFLLRLSRQPQWKLANITSQDV